MGAPWKLYDVTVDGYGTSIMTGASRGKVIADTWRSDVFSHISFRDFLKICRARVRSEPLAGDHYDYVRNHYGFDARVGQRVEVRCGRGEWDRTGFVAYPNGPTANVHVQLDGREHVALFHPSDVRATPLPYPAQGGK